jgi:hypothetical protein
LAVAASAQSSFARSDPNREIPNQALGAPMPAIARVRVIIDDNVPENGAGIMHCHSAIAYDAHDRQITDHRRLLESAEFHSEAELIAEVARRVGVDRSIIEITS